MNEVKKNIQEEYEKFETYYRGVERQLQSLVLTDIMASLMTEEEKEIEDEDGNKKTIKVKKYDEFEKMVEQIKEVLESVQGTPKFNLDASIQSTLDSIERIRNEALISMRTLKWVADDVLKETEEVEKDA